MRLEDEKVMVRALYDSGMTIHQIAVQVRKSASWVYSRLNDEYAPKRKRDTADVLPEEIAVVPEDDVLKNELEEVRRLRADGWTYRKIADHFDRSIYWVHSRLRKGYQPRNAQTEQRFQKEAVIPFLISEGHAIVTQWDRCEYGDFVLEADIVSELDGVCWITEVKATATGHQPHTAIGQLVLHRALGDEGGGTRLQIALPEEAQGGRICEDLVEAIRMDSGIDFAFIAWNRNWGIV